MTKESERSRRGVLLAAGAGIAGVGVALAGCSTAPVPYDANEEGVAPGAAVVPTESEAAAGQAMPSQNGQSQGGQSQGGQSQDGQGQTAGAGGGAAMGTPLGSVADIPVGGGVIYTAEKVVVTQPVKGVFKAFSAVCTHVGCICNKVASGTIDCPCHGSEFRISDGAVVTGPAPSPLPARTISVSDGKILLQ